MVPNLMIGFGIDEVQAEYVAEIKLRHLNREYILKRTEEIEPAGKGYRRAPGDSGQQGEGQSDHHQGAAGRWRRSTASRAARCCSIPTSWRSTGKRRKIPDYPVHLFFTRDGYFKKITPQSLRMSGEQKLKEGDEVVQQVESTNNVDLLFFTDRAQVYKAKASDFADTKASVLGEYIPARLGMDEGENGHLYGGDKGLRRVHAVLL